MEERKDTREGKGGRGKVRFVYSVLPEQGKPLSRVQEIELSSEVKPFATSMDLCKKEALRDPNPEHCCIGDYVSKVPFGETHSKHGGYGKKFEKPYRDFHRQILGATSVTQLLKSFSVKQACC